jgi:antitoxin component HigA of HigAB toxin-antitoxin module
MAACKPALRQNPKIEQVRKLSTRFKLSADVFISKVP